MTQINDSAINAAFAEFIRTVPEAAAFNTEVNGKIIIGYFISQWGADSGAEENSSAWEIAFAAVKSQLTPDPDYVSQADKRRMDSMSSAEVRDALIREPGFRELWDRYMSRDFLHETYCANDLTYTNSPNSLCKQDDIQFICAAS